MLLFKSPQNQTGCVAGFYLCVLCVSLQVQVWINRICFDVVPTELLVPVAVPLRLELGERWGLWLPVPLPSFLPSHRLWTGPRRLLSLPVGLDVCQARGQPVSLRQSRPVLVVRSRTPSVSPQDLDLVAVFPRGEVAAIGGGWVAMKGDLVASCGV